MKLNIRNATMEDLPTLVTWHMEFLASAYASEMKTMGTDRVALLKNSVQNYYRRVLPDNNHVASLALFREEVIGCGDLTIVEESPSPQNPDGHIGFISGLFVREKYRNQGNGSQILGYLLRIAKKRLVRRLYLQTNRLDSPLFRESGFVDVTDQLIFCQGKTRLIR